MKWLIPVRSDFGFFFMFCAYFIVYTRKFANGNKFGLIEVDKWVNQKFVYHCLTYIFFNFFSVLFGQSDLDWWGFFQCKKSRLLLNLNITFSYHRWLCSMVGLIVIGGGMLLVSATFYFNDFFIILFAKITLTWVDQSVTCNQDVK